MRSIERQIKRKKKTKKNPGGTPGLLQAFRPGFELFETGQREVTSSWQRVSSRGQLS
jgi:hypothetical protein